MPNPGKLYAVNQNQPTPSFISGQALEGFVKCVVDDLNKYGMCALDNFLERLVNRDAAQRINKELVNLHSSGQLEAGQIMRGAGTNAQLEGTAETKIRSDLISWVSGQEKDMIGVRVLMTSLDCIIRDAVKHTNAGKLADYKISLRTNAMAACYPGGKSRYLKHVDNPHKDGRVLTTIYYVNKNWTESDGGELIIYSDVVPNGVATIKPKFDRVVFFWSDMRNPHEVRPANSIRLAVTIWYLDENERKSYIQNMKAKIVAQQMQKKLPATTVTSPGTSNSYSSEFYSHTSNNLYNDRMAQSNASNNPDYIYNDEENSDQYSPENSYLL